MASPLDCSSSLFHPFFLLGSGHRSSVLISNMTSRLTKFVNEPAALICPVCQKIFREPVISVRCGHTFCQQCIESMIRAGTPCPVDDVQCDTGQLVLNRAVSGQIDDLLIYCCHGLISHNNGLSCEKDEGGCSEVIRFGDRQHHEDSCGYSKTVCPVGGEACGLLRKHAVEDHLSKCTKAPCPYSDFGCDFRGSKAEICEHKSQCGYKDESQLLAITIKQLTSVKTQNENLQLTMQKLVKSVEKLSAEKQTMVLQMEQQALAITTLTSRMDNMEAELDAFKSVKLRRSNGPPPTGDLTPSIHSRRSYVEQYKRYSNDSLASMSSLYTVSEGKQGSFVWQMPFTLKCIGTFRGHKATVWCQVAYGSRLYSGSSDGNIKVWDIADLRRGCLKTIPAHKDATMCLAVGKGILYSSGTDLSLRSWQIDTLEEIGKVDKAHDGITSAMVCSKEYVISSSIASIKFWDPLTLTEVHSISSGLIGNHWVRALVYDKRQDLLYSGSHNNIHVWKASGDFTMVKQLSTSYGAIYSLAVTKRNVIVGTHNQNIQVYDRISMNHTATLSGHIGIVTVLRVTESYMGAFMFSASSDSTVQVWNLENSLPIMALQRHEGAIHSMAVWHDTVFTGSEDQEIKVFKYFKL